MATLYDFIKVGNTSYGQLKNFQRRKIDQFVHDLKREGLEPKILALPQGEYRYAIDDRSLVPPIYETNMPPELLNEIDKVWMSLND